MFTLTINDRQFVVKILFQKFVSIISLTIIIQMFINYLNFFVNNLQFTFKPGS